MTLRLFRNLLSLIILVTIFSLNFMTPISPLVVAEDDATNPYDLISVDRMLETVEHLASIQPYSGWRNSASEGEVEAIDYMQARTTQLDYLLSLGLTAEVQDFNVQVATEIWTSDLYITVNGLEQEIPADSPRGSRERPDLAVRVDTDGQFNDQDNNPVEVSGGVIVVRTVPDVFNLQRYDLTDKVVFLDESLIDTFLTGDQGASIATEILSYEPMAVVTITQFSDEAGLSHGTGVGDFNRMVDIEHPHQTRVLYARLEDFAEAGITSWEDLATIESARLVLDIDVSAPGDAQNLIVTIPGKTHERAFIMGAHIDSPNSPGALDDGTGSAILLEVLTVLNDAQIQPEVDLVFVWFGAEEIGLYGSQYFAATHQELLDRTILMTQIDCLADPINGVSANISATSWNFIGYANQALPWLEFAQTSASNEGIAIDIEPSPAQVSSDNSSFNSFDVPNYNIGYWNLETASAYGGIHYAGHLHSPYDTLERVLDQLPAFEQMATMALSNVLNMTDDLPEMRLTPASDKHVLFIASQTEAIHTSVNILNNFAQTFAMFGYDVDGIPFGETFSEEDLATADVVVVLPTIDYQLDTEDPTDDVAWSDAEIEALVNYVDAGGFMIITNSWRANDPFSLVGTVYNEDWADMNALTEHFGVSFNDARPSYNYQLLADTPLLDDIESLSYGVDTAVSFSAETGITLIGESADKPLLSGLQYGDNGGLVLVVGDYGILRSVGELGRPTNLQLWFNIVLFATQQLDNTK